MVVSFIQFNIKLKGGIHEFSIQVAAFSSGYHSSVFESAAFLTSSKKQKVHVRLSFVQKQQQGSEESTNQIEISDYYQKMFNNIRQQIFIKTA